MSAGILMFIIFSSLRLYRSDNFLLIHSSISDSSQATLAGPIFIEREMHPLSYKGISVNASALFLLNLSEA